MERKVVFIIDDDEIYQFTTKRMIELGEFDIQVESFLNAQDALDYLKEATAGQLPDFIFLDINMPVMDGWEFLAHYKAEEYMTRKNPKIFMVSSSTDTNDKVKSQSFQELYDYIVKPFSFDILKKCLG